LQDGVGDIDTNRASAEATQRILDNATTVNGTVSSVLTNNISADEVGGGRSSALSKSKGADTGE